MYMTENGYDYALMDDMVVYRGQQYSLEQATELGKAFTAMATALEEKLAVENPSPSKARTRKAVPAQE
jgi:hypothetical protein